MPIAMVNDKLVDSIPVGDRGLAYGDGVFETIRISDRSPILWNLHLDRLGAGCERLGIVLPADWPDYFSRCLKRLVREAGWSSRDYVAKLIVTRGVGGRGYRPTPGAPNLIASLHELPPDLLRLQQTGMKAKVLNYRLPHHPALAGIKHLNRLDQVMASLELDDEDEGLLCDPDGLVIEGTKSNLLLVKDGQFLTPDLSRCGVAGVMRQYMLTFGQDFGIQVRISNIHHSQLAAADALVMMNSVIGLCPVRQLDNIEFKIPESLRALQSSIHEKLYL